MSTRRIGRWQAPVSHGLRKVWFHRVSASWSCSVPWLSFYTTYAQGVAPADFWSVSQGWRRPRPSEHDKVEGGVKADL